MTRRISWILAVLFPLLGGCASAPVQPPAVTHAAAAGAWPAATWIPMKVTDAPKITIRLTLEPGGEPMWVPAIIDTGSSFGVLLPERLAPKAAPRGTAIPAFGVAGPHDIYPIGEATVEIAGVVLPDVPVAVSDTDRVNVGTQCLERLGGVLFDWGQGRFGVAEPSTSPAPGWSSLPLSHEFSLGPRITASTPLPFVDATLDGRPVRVILDTASDGEVCGAFPLEGEATHRVLVEGAGRTVSARRMRRNVMLILAGLPPFVVRPISLRFGPALLDGVVGLEVLSRQPFWMDYTTKQARFWAGGTVK